MGVIIWVAGGVFFGGSLEISLDPDHPGYHSFHRRKNTEIC